MAGRLAKDRVGHQESKLVGLRVAFIGKLASMTHREASEWLLGQGGHAVENVGTKVDLVVVGEEGWALERNGELPRQLQLAMRLRDEGESLEIVSEADFLTRFEIIDHHQQMHRHCTPAMLSRILEVSVATVHAWARRGLIRPVKTVFRIQYFDFQEASGAKVITRLVSEGISEKKIERALSSLRRWLPHVQRPLTQLALLAQDKQMLVRHGNTLVEASGQQLLDFNYSMDTDDFEQTGGSDEEVRHSSINRTILKIGQTDEPDRVTVQQCFEEGRRLEDNNQIPEAVKAFHHALILGGPHAEINFHLGHAFYRMNDIASATERFRGAVEIDPDYVEAWNNLGSVLAERGQHEDAIEAFETALRIHPQYADAHYNLADTFEQLGRHEEAVPHWQIYLEHDSRSAWAAEAIRCLELNKTYEGENSETPSSR